MSRATTGESSRGRVGVVGTAATHPALGQRARELVIWMDRVRQAEAVYARYHVDLSRDGASLWRALTSARRRREAALAFDGLVRTVRGLRTSWELFRLRAATEGTTWLAALRRTLPGLLDGGGNALRRDTTFSYAAAMTAADIARCFRWRLESGLC